MIKYLFKCRKTLYIHFFMETEFTRCNFTRSKAIQGCHYFARVRIPEQVMTKSILPIWCDIQLHKLLTQRLKYMFYILPIVRNPHLRYYIFSPKIHIAENGGSPLCVRMCSRKYGRPSRFIGTNTLLNTHMYHEERRI